MLDNIQSIVPLGEIVYARMFGKPSIDGKHDQIGRERRELQKQYRFFKPPCEVREGDDEAEVAMAVDIHNRIMKGEVDAVVVFAKDHLNRPIARIAGECGVPYYGIAGPSGVSPEYKHECANFFVLQAPKCGELTLEEEPRDKIRAEISEKTSKRRPKRGRKKQREQESQ